MVRFLSLNRSKLSLWSAKQRAGYFSNLACDWLSIVWAYSEQETENGPWSRTQHAGTQRLVTAELTEAIHMTVRAGILGHTWFYYTRCHFDILLVKHLVSTYIYIYIYRDSVQLGKSRINMPPCTAWLQWHFRTFFRCNIFQVVIFRASY